jgi:RNA polymerase sigma-70 factor, ECF subfamily
VNLLGRICTIRYKNRAGGTSVREEKRLITRLKQGDRRAFEEFVDQYGPQIHRLVRRYVSSADADDITQEIFVDVWRSIGGFRGDAALSTWLYRLATNRCLRYCKREKPATLPLEEERDAAHDDDAPFRHAVQSETADKVHCAVERLPDGQRDVVILCELHGLTYQECASVLDIPVGTVKSRLSNACRKLRESLRGYVNPDGIATLPPVPMETLR